MYVFGLGPQNKIKKIKMNYLWIWWQTSEETCVEIIYLSLIRNALKQTHQKLHINDDQNQNKNRCKRKS